jgi:hypothetical protein
LSVVRKQPVHAKAQSRKGTAKASQARENAKTALTAAWVSRGAALMDSQSLADWISHAETKHALSSRGLYCKMHDFFLIEENELIRSALADFSVKKQ